MAADFVKFFVLFVFVVADLTNAQSNEGHSCVLRRTGASGICRSLKFCVSARNDLRRRITPQKCDGFIDTIPVVCCKTEGLPPTSSTTTGLSPARMITSRRRRGSNTCPPLPPGAIKETKTGQKAWDYCIDLAEAVRPCARRGLMNNASLTRSFECGHTATPLIVGGAPATANEFPHMVLLGFSNDPIAWDCGGTLISEDWVMTAAHCTYSRFHGTNVTHIRLGGGDTNSTLAEKYHNRVTQIVSHPEYIAPSIYNDIALLKTDRSVIFAKNVRPACLHTGNPVHDEKIIATGWGTTATRGKKSHSLLKVILEEFSHQECSEKIPPHRRKAKDGVRDATQFCAGHRENTDICQGDSGGPLQIYNDAAVECTYLVLAVTSTGKVCGVVGQPAIYTRVSAFIPWIEGIVWPN